MHYDLAINVEAAPGKAAIGPLIVWLKDEWNHILSSVTCTGTLSISSVFPVANAGQRNAYIIEFYWPSTENDINFEGDFPSRNSEPY